MEPMTRKFPIPPQHTTKTLWVKLKTIGAMKFILKKNRHCKREAQSGSKLSRKHAAEKGLNIQQITFTKNLILTEIIWTEVSSDRFKPILLEIYEFETRQKQKNYWTFSDVNLINIQI